MRRILVFLALLTGGCLASTPEQQGSTRSEGHFVGADGHRLWYRTIGNGPDTVVVVHGFPGHDSDYLAPDLLPLARGRTLLVYDQRGGGRSTSVAEPERYRLEDHVQDLEALRQHFGLQRLQLLAHSGGAAIVVLYGGTHPDRMARALLVAPPPLVGEGYGAQTAQTFSARLDSATWAYAQALDARLATAEAPAEVCRELTNIMLPRAFLVDAAAFARMKGDFCSAPDEVLRTRAQRRDAFAHSLVAQGWEAHLPLILNEVLVIHGDQDAIPAASARALAEALPNARVLMIEGADHLPWLDQPDHFFSVADTFLLGQWPHQAERPR